MRGGASRRVDDRSPASLAVSPNPAGTAITIRFNADTVARPIVLVDALGRMVHERIVPAGATSLLLDIGGLAPGPYYCRLGESTVPVAVVP
jgi:hypothetical protein